MRLSLLLLTIALTFCAATIAPAMPSVPPGAGPDDDLIAEALAMVGFTRADLGYRPRGYWNRYPDPVTTPYKLRAFDDLFSEPLISYDYTRTMAHAVELYTDRAYATDDAAKRSDRLYQLTYHLGVERLMGGFRSYSANLRTLSPNASSETPLADALTAIWTFRGRETEVRTFGAVTPWPPEDSPEALAIACIPPDLQSLIAQALYDWIDAVRWRDLAFRNCDTQDMADAFAVRDLGMTQGDGQVYYPAVGDVADDLDWQSLGYSWLKTAAAAGRLREGVALWLAEHPQGAKPIHLDIATPLGRLVIDGSGSSSIGGEPIVFYLDLGGDDLVGAPLGASSALEHPVAIAVDMGGDDTYGNIDAVHELTAGAGILGVGVLWDVGGDDRYYASNLTQGAGQLGCGLLFDEGEGSDHYTATSSAQGCGYLGVGLCIDGGGADEFILNGGEGQGFGGVGGIGVLADRGGDDAYYAEPDATKAPGRADYHSDFVVNVSNAQGVGSGRRGDGSDGHSWAGGLGAIIDLAGDDHYTAGNFSLGTGYWYGIGLVWDGAGDDIYDSVYFTQASGAHYCIGALIDEGDGDDRHELGHNAGAALGFGWDYTNALFLDRGGDDIYSAKLISYGCGEVRSNAFFLELGGDDTYTFQEGLLGFGAVDWRNDYAQPSPLSPYNSYASSVGLFLDTGGADRYVAVDGEGVPVAESVLPMRNDGRWEIPDPSSLRYGFNNHGIGIDQEGGRIWELERWTLFAATEF